MSKFTHLTFFFLTLFGICSSLSAQDAIIRGKVVDAEFGEGLLAATIILNQNDAFLTGTDTDLDGNYSLEVAPGNYQLIISYISYVSDTLDITADAKSVVFNETILYQEGTILEEVVVKAKAAQSSDLAINLTKLNSINSIDGISVDYIKRTGDSDVAGALRRITGVSVESGKYVTVRGLGDRYSKVLLNGGEIPALDPNRNTPQLDIFPSGLLDNVIVYKNFTPDLPGSFTGGLVDIRTKSHPEQFQLSFSASFSYNEYSNLRDNFLSYRGGDLDWLGIDDGTRDLSDYIISLDDGIIFNDGRDTIVGIPLIGGGSTSTTDSLTAVVQDEAANSLPSYYTLEEKSVGINQNYQFSFGDQLELGKRPFGYFLGLSYRNSLQNRENFQLERHVIEDEDDFDFRKNAAGSLTQEEVLWGSVVGLSYKPGDKNKLSFTFMHNQSGINETRKQSGEDLFDRASPNIAGQLDTLIDEVQSFTERSLDAFQLKGEQVFGKLKADWTASYTISSDDQPDLRIFQYLFSDDVVLVLDSLGLPIIDSTGFPVQDTITVFDYEQSVNTSPVRYYRDLDEINLDLKLNLELPFNFIGGRQAKFKFGGSYSYKDRDFVERQFDIGINNIYLRDTEGAFRPRGDLATFFARDSFGIQEVTMLPNGNSRYQFNFGYSEQSSPNNTYFADQLIWAGYAMFVLPLTEKLELTLGARYETTDIHIETKPSDSGEFEQGDLEREDILPAALIKYQIGKSINLRGGYSRTLARPSFRELAPYANFAFVGDFIFAGNPNLDRTLIDNYDLRFEWFPTPAELISVSGFYKNLDNPIERGIPRSGQTDLDAIIIQNVDNATSYGIEVEIQKNLSFISPAFQPFRIGGNFTYIESFVDLDSITRGVAEDFGLNPNNKPLIGQPDFTLNLELSYIENINLGLQVSLNYTLFGQRMDLAGGANFNVYEQSRGLLNFSIRKRVARNFGIRLRANNLLDPKFEKLYKAFEDDEDGFLFESYRIGRTFSIGFSYEL